VSDLLTDTRADCGAAFHPPGKRLPFRPLARSDLTNDPTTDPADIRWVSASFSLEDSPGLQMLNG
jgi:hypothetical protein